MQRSDTKKYHLEAAPSRSGAMDLTSSVASWRMMDSPMSERLRKTRLKFKSRQFTDRK